MRWAAKVAVSRLRFNDLPGNRGCSADTVVSRSSYVQSESQNLVDRLFDGEVAPLVAHFAEHRALTPKDIQLLKKLIADLEDE